MLRSISSTVHGPVETAGFSFAESSPVGLELELVVRADESTRSCDSMTLAVGNWFVARKSLLAGRVEPNDRLD
eukprot:COSAG02_NODE_17963_length_968_cov_1.696203_1_plen_73_part_00